MRILGIETSCDETAAAVVENGTKILANVVASSVALHRETGGIIPETAAREQVRYIIPVIQESLKASKLKSLKEIDALAVTVGPGLIGSLLVGIETAKALAYVYQKPLIAVNHLQAHLYANFLNSKLFPAIGLVVSGGHTDLVLMTDHGKIKWLGGTRDDAAGECFDKCSRLLGLGYPGGPEIEAAASQFAIRHSQFAIRLPRPMINQKNYDFSFAGLKTAVFHQVGKFTAEQLANEIQEAIVEVLVTKTIRAAKEYQAKSILLGGGVAANSLLRQKFKVLPPKNLCTDNGAVIAASAFFNYRPVSWREIEANPSLRIDEIV